MEFFFFVSYPDKIYPSAQVVWGTNHTLDSAIAEAKLTSGKWRVFRMAEDAGTSITVGRV